MCINIQKYINLKVGLNVFIFVSVHRCVVNLNLMIFFLMIFIIPHTLCIPLFFHLPPPLPLPLLLASVRAWWVGSRSPYLSFPLQTPPRATTRRHSPTRKLSTVRTEGQCHMSSSPYLLHRNTAQDIHNKARLKLFPEEFFGKQ